MNLTLQKRITRTPFFIKNRMILEASDKDERLPNTGAIESIRGGFHRRYSFSPEGAPSFETTSSSFTSSAKSFPMYSAGFASVALHEMKRNRWSVSISYHQLPIGRWGEKRTSNRCAQPPKSPQDIGDVALIRVSVYWLHPEQKYITSRTGLYNSATRRRPGSKPSQQRNAQERQKKYPDPLQKTVLYHEHCNWFAGPQWHKYLRHFSSLGSMEACSVSCEGGLGDTVEMNKMKLMHKVRQDDWRRLPNCWWDFSTERRPYTIWLAEFRILWCITVVCSDLV